MMNRKRQLAVLVGAVLIAALTFLAARRAAETPQPSLAHDKTALGTLGPDLERWLQIARMRLEERGAQSADIERSLEYTRAAMESMDPSEWEAYFDNAGYYTWKWDSGLSDLQNRIYQKLFELNGSTDYPRDSESTPPEIIEILVEGLDDLAAAKKLFYPGPGVWRPELNYSNIYADRALAKDPTSREALISKARLAGSAFTVFTVSKSDGNPVIRRRVERVDGDAAARRLIEWYPNDNEAARAAARALYYDYPEEAIAFLEPLAPKDGYNWAHITLSASYERLDMFDMVSYHLDLAQLDPQIGRTLVSPELRRFPSIWEVRAAAAAAATPTLSLAKSPAPVNAIPDPRELDSPPLHDHPEPPPSVEPSPLPPDAEMDMAAAYADFAKAYQSAFETEYALSEATPEGYMNALLGMARAFARAGDAKRGQDAYNAVRKCYSREAVQQVFRQMDEQDRLRRQASNAEDDDEDE